jgi:Trk-type K+ transport system membrane component
MKKLVALMAAILMVGGMFVGVALAATTIRIKKFYDTASPSKFAPLNWLL